MAALCRLLLAAVFLFSGFVKAVDPVGSQIKFGDYLAAFGMPDLLSSSWLMLFAVLLAAFEFMIGVYLLFGIYRKASSWAVFVVMLLFTPFTLYTAIANPVADCGCFGDAWLLTNTQTFLKNLLLLFLSAFLLLCGRTAAFRMISDRGAWMVSLYSFLFVLCVAFYGIRHLPLFDFRPYSVGSYLPDKRVGEMPVYETVFLFEKNGKTEEFSEENYPDSTWQFLDRRTVVLQKGRKAPLHDFALMRLEDGEEMADTLLNSPRETLLLIAPNLPEADRRNIDLVNDLYDYAGERGWSFYGVTASDGEEIERWIERTSAEYPFCTADESLLKTMARSNPSLMLMKGGVVMGKWAFREIPSVGEMETLLYERSMQSPAEIERRQFFKRFMWTLLLFFVPLLLFKGIDSLSGRKRKSETNEEQINKSEK